MSSRSVALVTCILTLGCGTPPAPVPADAPISPDQLPPEDDALLPAWLDARSWESWDCQVEPHPAVGPSPHGMNRICQNVLVEGALGGSGDWPVGATLVKENFDDSGTLAAVFLETRRRAGPGRDAWYYLRRDALGGADVVNAGFCFDCHAGAPRDFVWSTVEP